MSVRATRARPCSARASAGTLPPPSPWSATSLASSASSPSRSPSSAAAKKRCGELLAPLPRGLEARPVGLDVPARPHRELARVGLGLADDRGDLAVAVVEHVAQQEHGALVGRQPLEQGDEGERERIGELRLLRRVGARVGDERLGQPLARVVLAPDPRRAELIDRQASGDRREEGPRRRDLLARVMEAQERLLRDVLGLGDAPEHAVGDPERQRAQLGELPVFDRVHDG